VVRPEDEGCYRKNRIHHHQSKVVMHLIVRCLDRDWIDLGNKRAFEKAFDILLKERIGESPMREGIIESECLVDW
jgi:hypothetical protein